MSSGVQEMTNNGASPSSSLTHLDLFSGIGGFALAAEWAGFRTIGFVEIDKYCRKVLNKHWPDVPVVEDIRDVETIKTVAEIYKGNGSVTIVTGGFPCQPFSVAGKRGGKGDNRYLWPEMLRIIHEIRPRWVLGENVAGIVRMALDTVLSDLEGEGYTCQAFIIPACAVNAWHRRDRVWIVGYASSNGLNDGQAREGIEPRNQRGEEGQDKIWEPKGTSSIWNPNANANSDGFSRYTETEEIQSKRGAETTALSSSKDVADSSREGLEVRPGETDRRGIIWQEGQAPTESGWWAVEPELGRVAHGIPHRVDRLKCLGNAIVPQVAYEILKGIAEIENGQQQ